jgi:hypothetical protein
LSIDAEFEGTVEESVALGAWSWKRRFQGSDVGTYYVLGVPGRMSSAASNWNDGHVTIQWHSPSGFSTPARDLVASGVCQKWSPTSSAAVRSSAGESAPFFAAQGGIECAPFDDVVRNPGCGSASQRDHTLLAFVNAGAGANFNRQLDSTLLIGQQTSACNAAPELALVFDTLTFTGCTPGAVPTTRVSRRKRASSDRLSQLGLVYDEELRGLVHVLHAPSHATGHSHKRQLDDAALLSHLASPLNAQFYNLRVATGQFDATSPQPWPETYQVLNNIDPSADFDAVVEANVVTGPVSTLCNVGSIGCSCRTESGAAACDAGLECGAIGACLLPSCTSGKPGCACADNGSCDDGALCTDGTCKLTSGCTPGSAGCACSSGETCTDGSTCAEGLCVADAAQCTAGGAGCTCDAANQCAAPLECSAALGLCVAPLCTFGAAGCRCTLDGACDAGFECNPVNNVCGVVACARGDPGCECTLASSACNRVGFNCIDVVGRAAPHCIADAHPTCADSQQRCIEECGTEDNVRVCPPCANGKVYCRSGTPAAPGSTSNSEPTTHASPNITDVVTTSSSSSSSTTTASSSTTTIQTSMVSTLFMIRKHAHTLPFLKIVFCKSIGTAIVANDCIDRCSIVKRSWINDDIFD